MNRRLQIYKALIWLTLYAAALHFFDNVYFFDEYPEPAWMTRLLAGALWIPVALLAHRAVDCVYTGQLERSYALVHSYVIVNWISLLHYLYASPRAILPRINVAIGLQCGLAAVLLGYTLWLQSRDAPESLPTTARHWVRRVTRYALILLGLELVWPSKYDLWWMWWRA